MFNNIDFDNFPSIISSGSDFSREIHIVKSDIFPRLKSHFHNKLFSVNFFDLIYPNCKANGLKSYELNDFVLLNLDAVRHNGSIGICLLGEQFEQEANDDRSTANTDYQAQLNESMKLASDSGYSWILESHQETDPSLLEILSLQAGLMSGVKYPLFYFRVSGGPISDSGDQLTRDNLDDVNNRMERLKQKLMRNGLPLKFYGSASEFEEAVETDLHKIFSNFPDKTNDRDMFCVDQQCFEDHRKRAFTSNANIERVFEQLDTIYDSLALWKETNKDCSSPLRIDELIADFYRKDFSDRLTNTYKKLSIKTSAQAGVSQQTKIIILTGPRGSGKSTILINWLRSKKSDSKMIYAVHYCEASFSASDLRIALRRIIKQIRSSCGFTLEQDDYEMYSLDSELTALSQELLGAMLLARQHGLQLLILIDGLDHLGDKCSSTPKQIKFIDWMPDCIPDNVRIIMSCTSYDSALIKLKERRTDISIIETLPDSPDLQQSLIEYGISNFQTWTKKFGQTFPAGLIQHIDNWPLIRTPLVQRILAQVYHTLGTSVHWSQFIGQVSECQTLVELVKRVLKLDIQFLNWEVVISAEKSMKKKYIPKKDEEQEENSIQGWVPDCLSLLALSQCGLTIDIILTSLELLGYVKDYQVVDSDLWRLFHFARDFLLRFHDNKFVITHSVCREIVEHTFLAIASCSSVEARSQECQDSMYLDKRCKMHILLAYVMWNNRSATDNYLSECIYHLDRASDHQSMARILFNPRVVLSMFDLDLRSLDDWHGQLRDTHQFQYCCNVLNAEGYDLVSNIADLLNQYYNFDLVIQKNAPLEIQSDSQIVTKQIPFIKNNSQSEFSKNLEIVICREKDEREWSKLTEGQKCRFLLLIGQICVLLEYKTLARQIYNYIEKISRDNILICHVLWFDISLDSSSHSVFGNKEYVDLALNKIDELTGCIFEDGLDRPPDLINRVRYLRCKCLVLKYSTSIGPSKGYSSRSGYLEIMSYAKDLKSVILSSIINELEYNSMDPSETPQAVQEKLSSLSNLIVKLETWTGPLHKHMARLFVYLAHLFKCGNFQSKLKAEACCRRALWIWKGLLGTKENQYNHEENECIELLFTLLLQDPTHSSLNEAKTLIYTTFDNRMKFLGCYNPLTTQLVPIVKLVNSLDAQLANHLHSENRNSSRKTSEQYSEGPSLSSKNQSNLRNVPTIVDVFQEKLSSISRIKGKYRKPPSSNLQFINRYFSHSDCFSEDIDWNDIASGRSGSKSSRISGSRLNSALSKRNSALSLHLNPSPLRCQSTSACDDRLTYTFLGHTAALSSLVTHSPSTDRIFTGRSIKQVRFNNFRPPGKTIIRSAEVSKIIQRKLQDMNPLSSTPVALTKRLVSANFSRPYHTVDPIL